MRERIQQTRSGERPGPLDQVELDARGTILSIDDRLVRDLDVSRAQLVGKSASELVDSRDRADVLSLLARVVADERPGQATFRILRPDGVVRWVQVSARPYRSDEGELRLGVMGRDVTEREEMHAALRDQVEAERRIGELSRSFLGLAADEIEEGIDRALATAAALAGADRCSLGELPIGPEITWFEHFSWNAEGVEPRVKGLDEARWRSGDYAWMGERFLAGEVVHVPAVDELSDERRNLREGLTQQGVRAYLGIPILSGGQIIAVFDADRVDEAKGWSEQEIDRLRLIGEIIANVLRRVRVEQANRQSDLGLRSTADFSRFFLDLETDRIEEGVRERLADLAELAGAEHALLYSFREGRAAGLEAYEWWDARVDRRDSFATDFDTRSYPWTFGLFARREPIHVPRLDGLPPEANSEREVLERRGVRSMLGIPVVGAGQSVGFLGFETLSHEHHWSDEVITLLRLAGEIFISALRQRRSELELRESQQSLLQSQKMEAVGRLAGGIAHDFNNHLAVMLGNARFLREELGRDSSGAGDGETAEAIADLERSAEHCSQLTRSLLAFSRRSPVSIRPLDIRRLIDEVTELVGPLIPASIDLVVRAEGDVESVAADSIQLQQVLVNLIVNARDAMPEGGRIELTAAMRQVGVDETVELSLPRPGQYVELGVRDGGVGIPQDVLEHIFEPFYTTKEMGKGTGLGLATAYGIVEQSEGIIDVESEPGSGTHFRVLLPAWRDQDEAAPTESVGSPDGGAETVLVAEDEVSVRRLLTRILSSAGYQVLEGGNGREALDVADGHAGPVHVLVTDLAMPGMGGAELAEQLSASRDGLRVLVLSGDLGGLDADIQTRLPGVRCLQKPFGREELLDALRALLADSPA
jgi:PAS domain S-box-containing protein